METSETLLNFCMNWLTEISQIQWRIEKMHSLLNGMKLKREIAEVNEKYADLLRNMKDALDRLKAIECSIIYFIQQNANYPLYVSTKEKGFSLLSEEELFEKMKYNYYSFIELQRNFYKFINQNQVPKTTSKIIHIHQHKAIQNKENAPKQAMLLNIVPYRKTGK